MSPFFYPTRVLKFESVVLQSPEPSTCYQTCWPFVPTVDESWPETYDFSSRCDICQPCPSCLTPELDPDATGWRLMRPGAKPRTLHVSSGHETSDAHIDDDSLSDPSVHLLTPTSGPSVPLPLLQFPHTFYVLKNRPRITNH